MSKKWNKEGLTRRSFIKGVAIGDSTAVLPGINFKKAKAVPLTPIPKKWDYETGMLIVGAGIAGRMAAIEAHDAGAKVLIAEKSSRGSYCLGGSSVCGGTMCIAGTSIQAKNGIKDSPDILYEDMARVGKGSNIPEILRLYVDNAAETYERVLELGAKCIGLRDSGGHSRKRAHNHNGIQVLDALMEQIKKRNILVLSKTRGKRLIMDPTNGRVLGLEAKGVEGKNIFLKGKVTLLTTGGFTGSPEMIDRYVPKARGALACALSPASIGDGNLMAMAIGADTTHPYSVTTYPHGFPVKGRYGSRWSGGSLQAWIHGAITVNKEGKRYVNEAMAPCEVGEAMLLQKDKTGYTIFDKDLWEDMKEFTRKFRPAYEMELFKKQKDLCWRADSVKILAAIVGIDAEGIEETLKKYNSFVENGQDLEFKKPKKFLLRKIETPPFYAVKQYLVILHGSGGLRANTRLQILDVYGNPIPGLYGAGEVVGGTSGEVYLSGTHYPVAMTFGYLAGKKFAVKEALKA